MTQTYMYMLILRCTDTTGSLSPRSPPQLISRSQAGSPGAFYWLWSHSAALIQYHISPNARLINWLIDWVDWLAGQRGW